MLKTGVSLTRQSTGLKAASPWNRSSDRLKILRVEELVGPAEEVGWFGRRVLSNGVVAVGTWRGSKIACVAAVTSRKVCWPMIG